MASRPLTTAATANGLIIRSSQEFRASLANMKVHWLQHADFEDLGCIAPWLAARGDAVSCTRLYAGEKLPLSESFDWLIVMGGPMNVYEYERHPRLKDEKALIRETVAAGKCVLGICLGAQLLADVLGGQVARNAQK